MNRRGFLFGLARSALAGAVASSIRWLPMPEMPQVDRYVVLELNRPQWNDAYAAHLEAHRRSMRADPTMEFYGLGFPHIDDDHAAHLEEHLRFLRGPAIPEGRTAPAPGGRDGATREGAEAEYHQAHR